MDEKVDLYKETILNAIKHNKTKIIWLIFLIFATFSIILGIIFLYEANTINLTLDIAFTTFGFVTVEYFLCEAVIIFFKLVDEEEKEELALMNKLGKNKPTKSSTKKTTKDSSMKK